MLAIQIEKNRFLMDSTNGSIPPMKLRNRSTVTILGVQIDRITIENAVDTIEEMIKYQNKHLIVPVNPEMIMTAQHNPEFLRAINNASLALPDGIGVIWASRLYGTPIETRITGVDTVQSVAQHAAKHGYRIFFLGAAEGIADQAAQKLQRQYPGLTIAGTYAGSPRPEEEQDICQKINDARPHILFIAYGAPKQELWITRNFHKLHVPVAMCVGGTFDFIAGEVTRAPRWVQSIGCEWLYRLANEPRRWRRMIALPR